MRLRANCTRFLHETMEQNMSSAAMRRNEKARHGSAGMRRWDRASLVGTAQFFKACRLSHTMGKESRS